MREKIVKSFLVVLATGVLCLAATFFSHSHLEQREKMSAAPRHIELCDKTADNTSGPTAEPFKTRTVIFTKETSTIANMVDFDDRSTIKYPTSAEVRNHPLWATFQARKSAHAATCRHSRQIFDKVRSFEAMRGLQDAIAKGVAIPDEKACVPVMSREGSPENHFFDDEHKFHVCLPTKTGSTNWLKALVDLWMFDGDKEPEDIDSNLVYKMPQMPRFQNELKEFVKGREGREGYFTLITVRHPFARLYSAWKDKFRNNHPWYAYIKKKFGEYLDPLERKNMTDEPYEVSFEAFLELAALSRYDTERDRHWKSMQTYCTTCNIEYDFILKQETAMAENDFLISAMGLSEAHPLLHIPGIYKTTGNMTFTREQWRKQETTQEIKTITMEEIAEPYKGVQETIIKELYRAYYPDFVYFNYSIDEILAVSGPDDDSMKPIRLKVHDSFMKKFGYYQKRSDDMTCEGDLNYNCQYGSWRVFQNKTLGGTAQPFGQKKFTILKNAMAFACDKETVHGITWDNGFYYLRGGSTGLRNSMKNETTWIKQYSSIVIV